MSNLSISSSKDIFKSFLTVEGEKRYFDDMVKLLQETLQDQLRQIYPDSDIYKDVEVEADKTSRSFKINITSKKLKALEEGVKPHKMTYLLHKTIPIKTESGETIFRKVTPHALAMGKWQHPGREGTEIVASTTDTVIQDQIPEEFFTGAIDSIVQKFVEEQMNSAFGSGG